MVQVRFGSTTIQVRTDNAGIAMRQAVLAEEAAARAETSATETRTKFRSQNLAGLSSYRETFGDMDGTVAQTSNGADGGVWEVVPTGLAVTSGSNSLYRSRGPFGWVPAVGLWEVEATWTLTALNASNGRVGIMFGDADAPASERMLLYYRGDGAIVKVMGDGSGGVNIFGADSGRVYAQGATVKLRVRGSNGSAQMYVTNPTGAEFGPFAVPGTVPGGDVFVTSFTSGIVTFNQLDVDLTTRAQEERVQQAEENSLPRATGVNTANTVAAVMQFLGAQAVRNPSGWGGQSSPFGISIYRGEDGTFAAGYDHEQSRAYTSGWTEVWVAPGGSGDGSSSASPLGSLATAMATATNRLWIRSASGGLFTGANGAAGVEPTAQYLQIESEGDPIVSSREVSVSWSAVSGGPAYSCTVANFGMLVDQTRETDGPYVRTSLSAVQAEPNTFYLDGTTLYVHLHDGRAPDGDVEVYDNQPNFVRRFFPAGHFWARNLTLLGGRRPLDIDCVSANQVGVAFLEDVLMKYGSENGSRTGNGLLIQGAIQAVLKNCRAIANIYDGLNYHSNGTGAPNILEVDCEGSFNGRVGADWSGGPNNGSTMHDGGTIRRVGTRCFSNIRNFHDTCGSAALGIPASWVHNLGCEAGQSRGTGSTDAFGGYFAGTAGDTTDTTQMWLERCISDSIGSDLGTSANANIYTHLFDPADPVIAAGSNVASYTP